MYLRPRGVRLQCFDDREVVAAHDEIGRVHAAQPLAHAAVDQLLVLQADFLGVAAGRKLRHGVTDRRQWDKGRIVSDLVNKRGVSTELARTIASMVEEKVFSMGMTVVPSSLIRQLVLGDTAAVQHADLQLQMA